MIAGVNLKPERGLGDVLCTAPLEIGASPHPSLIFYEGLRPSGLFSEEHLL